jgi:hypothetical protein
MLSEWQKKGRFSAKRITTALAVGILYAIGYAAYLMIFLWAITAALLLILYRIQPSRRADVVRI